MNNLKNGKYKEHETFKWYKDGNLHREDGPAVVWNSGHKEWYQNGVLHREDEPAFEGKNGGQAWFLKGVQYTEEEFKKWESKKFLNEKLQSILEEKPVHKEGEDMIKNLIYFIINLIV